MYQTQVDVASGRIRSVEALIRWSHPTRGLISPLEFIPLAEENGLIERIGAWVPDTACRQTALWHSAGLPVSVAVNVSPLQFGRPHLPRSLGMRVTAEGVETFEQASALKALARNCLQGCYFGRPVVAHDIPALLTGHWPLEAAGPAGGGDSSAPRQRLAVVS